MEAYSSASNNVSVAVPAVRNCYNSAGNNVTTSVVAGNKMHRIHRDVNHGILGNALCYTNSLQCIFL